MSRSRVARTARGVAAAAVATFAAVVSHSAADGRAAPALGVAIAFTFAVPLCVLLAGRALSWPRLAVAVTLSQFAFHALMLIGVGEGLGGTGAGTAGSLAHAAHTAPRLDALAHPVMAGAASTPHLHGGGMWIAHAVAALVTILAIGHGERAARALVELSGWKLVARVLVWRPAAIVRRLPVALGRLDAVRPAVVVSVVQRRGPPRAA